MVHFIGKTYWSVKETTLYIFFLNFTLQATKYSCIWRYPRILQMRCFEFESQSIFDSSVGFPQRHIFKLATTCIPLSRAPISMDSSRTTIIEDAQ